MRALFLLPCLLTVACSRSTAPRTEPSATALSSVDAPAPVVPGVAPAVAPAGCDFTRGWQGTVAGVPVLGRLERQGTTLRGEYFYERIGTPIPLRGTITGDAVALTEGETGKETGQFAGTCSPDGHLQGAWTQAARPAQTFALESVGAREVAVVARHHQERKTAPKPPATPAAPSMGFAFEPKEPCSESLAWPEVFGAATPEAERTINARLALRKPLLTRDDEPGFRACVVGERMQMSRSFEVLHNASGVLSIRFSESSRYEGGTHPYDPGPESWPTFDLHTGRAVSLADIVATSPAGRAAFDKVLSGCARAWGKKVDDSQGLIDDIDEKFRLANPALLAAPTPAGLRIGATGYPPPARVLEGDGPTLRWSALLAAGALSPTSPIARLWATTTPSATPACL